MRRAFKALFPGAIVFVATIVVTLLPGGDAIAEDVAGTYGKVVYGAGLALAWVFHRSRVFVLLLCLGLMDVALAGAPDKGDLVVAFGTALVALTALLAVSRDRGIASRGGLLHIALGGAVASIAAVTFADPARVRSFAGAPVIFDGLALPGLPRITLVVAVAAFVAVSYGFFRGRGPVDRALVWGLVLLLVGMHPEIRVGGSALFLLATGLTLTLSVVETSYILAYRDELTGLPGRRALMQYLDGVKGLYTIAMVDVDHFKKFNDKHGHDVGDQVLQMVASQLALAPGGARAYRYGGEEFTLIFPGRTREQALPHLEVVRESVQQARFSLRSWKRPLKRPDNPSRKASKPKTLSVAVSIGMSDTSGDDDTPEVVLRRADQALYRAKKKGRNQVSK